MVARLYTVEKPIGNNGDWVLVARGTLAECYAWIAYANKGRRHQQTYRVVDWHNNVVQLRPEIRAVEASAR